MKVTIRVTIKATFIRSTKGLWSNVSVSKKLPMYVLFLLLLQTLTTTILIVVTFLSHLYYPFLHTRKLSLYVDRCSHV